MDWLRSKLPDWAAGPLDWLWSPGVVAVLSAASVVMLIASVLGIPWIIARVPEDYFCERRDRPSLLHLENPRLRLILRILKNTLGVVLLLAGIAMLVLPGQGIITMLVSLILLDIPGKRHLLAKIVSRPHVAHALNKIRKRHGQPPLEF